MQELNSQPDNAIVKGVWSDNYEKELRFVKNPVSYEKMSTNDPEDSPLLGQHTEQVLKEVCKYTPEYIE